MTGKRIAMFFLAGMCSVFFGYGSAATAQDKDEVNNFYRKVVEALKKPVHMRELVELVEKNPAIAKKCLDVCGDKAQGSGKQGAALRVVQDELQAAMILRGKTQCNNQSVQHVITLAAQVERDDTDRIFCLEKLISLCPLTGDAYSELGDLYLKQKRCGMAFAAYKKATELTPDQDSRKLLEIANECKQEYAKQKPLRHSQVKDLIVQEVTMDPLPGVRPKARIGTTIQRQILFDEWSYQIKDQFVPDLKVIGEALREELPRNRDVKLVIEGHTDKRGPYDRNMKLSKDRAEAIKAYLVQNFGVNPAQLNTDGCGPTVTYTPEENEAGYALNRRVEFKKLESAK